MPNSKEPMPERLGDAPIEKEFQEKIEAVADGLNEIFNGNAQGQDRKTGFILMVFPFGNGEGRVNYISNGANRKDVVALMKEQIARFEGLPEMSGTA